MKFKRCIAALAALLTLTSTNLSVLVTPMFNMLSSLLVIAIQHLWLEPVIDDYAKLK